MVCIFAIITLEFIALRTSGVLETPEIYSLLSRVPRLIHRNNPVVIRRHIMYRLV